MPEANEYLVSQCGPCKMPSLSIFPHLIKEDGFSHSSKTNQHHAFGGPTQTKPLETHFHVFPNSASARQFGRRAARPRCIGVADRIHNIERLAKLCIKCKLYNFPIHRALGASSGRSLRTNQLATN